MWDAYPEMLDGRDTLIVATSTWGEGELPDNAVGFVEDLEWLAPALDKLGYALLALGDRHYEPHYCEAARIFERLLDRLGAQRIQETLEIDEGPEQHDLDAAECWIGELAKSITG